MHPTGGSLRVFRQFAWLEAGSGKVALSRPTHQRVTPTVGRQGKIADGSLEGKVKLLQLAGTPRAHTCKCISSQVIYRHGVCHVAQQVIYGSSAIAALRGPLSTTFIAQSNGFHRVGNVPAPQMLREGKSRRVSHARSIGAQQCVHLTLGSLRVLQAFSPPQPVSHRTACRRPPQRR